MLTEPTCNPAVIAIPLDAPWPVGNFGIKEEEDVTVIRLPLVDPLLAPIVYVLPLQLLAYHVAVLKGTDVDQPRNLAKSVTVE